jgi:hypothetical protein
MQGRVRHWDSQRNVGFTLPDGASYFFHGKRVARGPTACDRLQGAGREAQPPFPRTHRLPTDPGKVPLRIGAGNPSADLIRSYSVTTHAPR